MSVGRDLEMGEQKKPEFTDLQSIRAKVKARVKKEEKQQQDKKDNESKDNNGITSRFVLDCLNANELGDGMLFAAIHKGKFLFNFSAGEWFFWGGHFWLRDITNRAQLEVESECEVYLEEAGEQINLTQKAAKAGRKDEVNFHEKIVKRLLDRVKRLRSRKGRNNCLYFASLYLTAKGEDFDQDPWLLGCKNGVLNLKIGKLFPGRPEQYITKDAPVEWNGIDAPAPLWEKILLEIFDGSTEVVDYLQRLFGYGITGLVLEHIFPVLWGKGRNGKSLILETIQHILGTLVVTLNPETLLDQGRVRNPSGPSPDIMSLKGARIASTSETDTDRKLAVSSLKRWTGGDTLVARSPHDRYETHFLPTHLLILSTNHKPQAPNDFALWERLHLVPFPLSFVDRKPVAENERRAKKGLLEKLHTEGPGILAWLVRGCLLWQQHGLRAPVCVLEATSEYRKDEDIFGDFLDESCELSSEPGVETSASRLGDAFDEWYKLNVSKRELSRRKFGMLLKDYGIEKFKRGCIFYRGIRLKNR